MRQPHDTFIIEHDAMVCDPFVTLGGMSTWSLNDVTSTADCCSSATDRVVAGITVTLCR